MHTATGPSRPMISGLTSAIGAAVSSAGETSSTMTRLPTPTWVAASPMPSDSYMVSNMS